MHLKMHAARWPNAKADVQGNSPLGHYPSLKKNSCVVFGQHLEIAPDVWRSCLPAQPPTQSRASIAQ